MASNATPSAQPTLAGALADLPARVRVHEIARRAGLNSKQAIEALSAAGVAVAAASSSVDRDVAASVLTTLLGGGSQTKAARTRRKPAAETKPTRATTAESSREPAAGATTGEATKRKPKKATPSAEPSKADSTKPESKKAASRRATSRKSEAKPSETKQSETKRAGSQKSGATENGSNSAEAKTAGSKAAGSKAAQAKTSGSTTSRGAARKARSSEPVAAIDSDTDVLVDADAALAIDSGSAVDSDVSPSPATTDSADGVDSDEAHSGSGRSRRRRRRGRSRGGAGNGGDKEQVDSAEKGSASDDESQDVADSSDAASTDEALPDGAGDSRDSGSHDSGPHDSGSGDDEQSDSSRRRRRRRRHRGGSGDSDDEQNDGHASSAHSAGVQGVKGSTRLEAKRQRRRDSRETRRRPQILSEAEFLARRESVERVMAVRQRGDISQVALLEDGVLVEHFVSQQGNASMIGNVYVGRVQNVLPSMEAAFVDIGKGRNAVLYAGEVNWDIAGLEGKERRIETALSSGDTVLVQVSKDPVGHKGARLTTQISLPGRFLVFVPDGGATGISRKLPDNERKRLKKILDKIVPAEAGVIIRTAAEGVGEEELAADVARLQAQWEDISAAARKATDAGSAPKQLYAEPDTLIKVIRDLFNSDISRLLVDGDRAWESLSEYVLAVAPELADRVSRYIGAEDVFAAYRIDEQITKALQRKVRLPSGGSLVIDRTEAMTVVDVNTGKFTGSGGNLEETVTRNNLEAAEEIVRQLRLRDIGGIIVVDFIDMVLESNRDLVLRRLTECLGRDRTRHQVAEVTSLGLVQMTRKRMGLGLVETFSEPCNVCNGRGIVLHDAPSGGESVADSDRGSDAGRSGRKSRRRGKHHDDHDDPTKFQPLVVERLDTDARPDPRGPKPPALFRAERAETDSVTDPVTVAEADAVDGAAANGTALVDAADTAARSAIVDSTHAQPRMTSSADEAHAPKTAHAAQNANPPKNAAKPTRRRRAAGRPAGAPEQVTGAVDLVLPIAGGASVPAEATSAVDSA